MTPYCRLLMIQRKTNTIPPEPIKQTQESTNSKGLHLQHETEIQQ